MFLLPGFLAAWVYYEFTSRPKPEQFERVVQALIFTILIQATLFSAAFLLSIVHLTPDISQWSENVKLVASVGLAAVLGLAFSYFANNDKFHALIRQLKITNKTSYPSEWFGELSQHITYVVLHLEGERRIMGWPKEWPSAPDAGHFSLSQPSWLTDDEEIPLTGVLTILIPAKDVKMVEFLEKTWE